MFVLSKIFWMVAQPLSLVFFLGLLALLLLACQWRRMGISALSLSLFILFATLYTSAGTVLLQGLESRFPRPGSDPASVACLIVLGGAFETEVTTARGGVDLNQAADRFVEALRLAYVYPQAKILVSGGDGSLSGRFEGDAVISQRFFSAFGIPDERLIGEATSRNTHENALNSRELLQREGLQNCLLVTSAFHMPRSVGLFRKAEINTIPWPTDYRTAGNVTLRLDFTQPTLNAQQTATAVREWIGLFAYWLTGRIEELYPAP
ncbi:YdcF family protein [Peteryoungia desertarenae]|uniref:YdcF family protein n=1 Tax=Peteryoungia desertarenae TaxID=1813451 RepID=A0ABX6QKB7_9HYPH|nr:YdcF family protein [Peteryoungia desertarenae]QLF68988.1 YdcF family protein [Peteryoungia desertarenae]